MNRLISIIIFTSFSLNLFSQTISESENKRNFLKPKNKVLSIDFHVGVPYFYGDIKNNFGYIISTKLNYQPLSFLSFNTKFAFGTLNGKDKEKGRLFLNRYLKTSIGGELYFLSVFHINKISKYFQPFGGLNLGVMKTKISKSKVNNIALENLNNDWSFLYTLTGGFKFKLNNSVDFNVKTVVNFTKTDLLDNLKPNVAANKHDDMFIEYKIGFSYHIGKQGKNALVWVDKQYFQNDTKKQNKKDKTSLAVDKRIQNISIQNDIQKGKNKYQSLKNKNIKDESFHFLNCAKKY